VKNFPKAKIKLLVVEKISAHDLAFEHDNVEMQELILKKDPSVRGLLLAHKEHGQAVKKLDEYLSSPSLRRICEWQRVYRDGLTAELAKEADIIITLGGDGTFLWAARFIEVGSTQIIGINSSPSTSVGYYSTGNVYDFCSKFDLLLDKRWTNDVSLTRLEYTINGKPPTSLSERYVLNEVLFCAEHPADMSRYLLKTREGEEEQKSSGVWVSTPAGSTAALLSAGGVIQPWSDERLQYVVREPYKAITNPDKSFYRLTHGFISPRANWKTEEDNLESIVMDSMEITCKMRTGILCLDGSTITKKVTYGDRITIRPSFYYLRVLGKSV